MVIVEVGHHAAALRPLVEGGIQHLSNRLAWGAELVRQRLVTMLLDSTPMAWPRLLLVGTICLAVAAPAHGQGPTFERLSIERGLSQSIIEQIVQDRVGFMWFVTEDGLNRYDGYRFTVYRSLAGDPGSLSHNELKAIHEDSSGMLWVGVFEGGLNRFDPVSERAIRYQHDSNDPASLAATTVRAILEDRSGALWIGTHGGGLDRLDRTSGRFEHFRADASAPGSLSHDDVRVLLEDRSGTLWVGTNGGGLDRLDRASGCFTTYRNRPDDPSSLSHDVVLALLEDRSGTLWVGTYGGGLDALDRASGRFTHHRCVPGRPGSISDDRIKALCEDHTGTLWVGTDGGGLCRFEPDRDAFACFRNDPLDASSLSTDRVYSLFEDRSQVLWIGTYGGGLDKLDIGRQRFRHYRNHASDPNSLGHNIVWSFWEDREGFTWIGTDSGGLDRWDSRTGEWRHFVHRPEDPGSLSHNTVRAVLEDRSGALWVATHGGGLNRLDRATERFTHYRHDVADPGSLAHDELRSLLEDRSGAIWVGTFGGGLDRFEPAAGEFIHHRHRPEDPDSISNDFIRQLLEDSRGSLWIGTQGGGVNRLDPGSGRFVRYQNRVDDPSSLSNDHVFAILEARDGTLWFGTFGGGINQLDRSSGRFRRLAARDGLVSDSVYAMLEGDQGELWISTSKGISRFDPGSETFRNFDVRDGLQSNEFNGASALRRSNGELLFGGINGFNAFFPREIGVNPVVPNVILTDLRLFNRPVRAGDAPRGRVLLERQITFTDAVELSYRDNVVSFEFAALHYSAPEKNRYAYNLEGFSKDWIPVDAEYRIATFTGLNPGAYLFRVRGANSDGVWNQEGATIRVTIAPPLWATWWFRTLAAALAIAVVLLALRSRTSQVRMRTELRAAHDAQMAIMPQADPDFDGFDISGVCIPASEVGGDFFDYIRLEAQPRRLWVAVGDVVGKAMPAAMTAVMSDGMLVAEIGQGVAVEQVLTSLNCSLYDKVGKRIFTALCLMELDGASGAMTFANAGLSEPLLRRGDLVEYLSPPGPHLPLAALSDTRYQSRSLDLAVGDVLVVFSDGLPEARGPAGELQGYDALCGLLASLPTGNLKAAQIRDSILADVRRFTGGTRQSDDITLVVVKRTAAQRGA